MRTSIACTLAAVAALTTLTAEAAIKVSATRTSAYSLYAKYGGWIPLNELGNQSIKFNMAEAKKLVLSFSMDCIIGGTSVNGILPAVEYDIRLNNVAVAPTGSSYGALGCGLAHPSFTSFGTRTSVTLQINAKQGVNTVDVYVTGLAPAGIEFMSSWATSLVIWD